MASQCSRLGDKVYISLRLFTHGILFPSAATTVSGGPGCALGAMRTLPFAAGTGSLWKPQATDEVNDCVPSIAAAAQPCKLLVAVDQLIVTIVHSVVTG